MLSALERSILSSVTVTGALAATIFMMAGIDTKAKSINIDRRPGVSASEGEPYTAIDRNGATFWIGGFLPPGEGNRRFDPPEDRAYIQAELGFSHLPGEPPELNPPVELIIANGAPGTHYLEYARPARIRILAFTEEIVDVDREYRFPAPPSLYAEKILSIPDRPGELHIPLEWLPPFPESTRFPENIRRIWFRLEILQIHKGERYPERIALTELRMVQRRSFKEGDRSGLDRTGTIGN
jgi:hypothetical protein